MTAAERLIDLKEQRSALIDTMSLISQKGIDEKRSLTTDEQKDWDSKNLEVRSIDSQMTTIQRQIELEVSNAQNAFKNQQRQQENQKVMKDYSIARAIRMAAGMEKFDGLEAEMHEEAVRESRNYNQEIVGIGVPTMILNRAMSVGVDSGAKGGQLVATEKVGFMEALQNKLVLKELGANFMTGLTGNISMPKGTAFTATWEGEVDSGAETDSTVTATTLSPHRLAAIAKVSTMLIKQSSYSVETFINTQLQKAIAIALQYSAINGASGGDNPVGILNTSGIGSVAIGATGGAPTWAHMVALEKELGVDNALMGKLAFLTNSKVKAILQQAKKDSGSGQFAWMNNEINGYLAAVSNSVPSTLEKSTSGAVLSAILFGNWEDLYIGQWGGLDLIADKYTLAGEGQLRIVANSYWDVALPRPESFAAIVDASTT